MNLESGVLQVHIEDIIPNRFQPRLSFDEQGLKELADSIREHGIIQPLVLRKLGDKYEIIAGERRYKAAQIAGLTTVPAVIANIDDNKSAEVALVENVQRRDLTAIEEARSYKSLLDKGYLTQEQLAKRMGLSQPAIANKLRLLNLDEEVQQALLEEKISERHARTLLSLQDKNAQREWLHRIINERLTVRQLDLELKKLKDTNNIVSSEDENEGTGEVPIVTSSPSIEDIKANAMDINEANRLRNNLPEQLEELETLDEPITPSQSPITPIAEPTSTEYTPATTVPEFNIATPNSVSTLVPPENIVEAPPESNKYFGMVNNLEPEPIPQQTFINSTELMNNTTNNMETTSNNNFEVFDSPTPNNSFIDMNNSQNSNSNKVEESKPPKKPKPLFNSPINPYNGAPLNTDFDRNPNNKFFTPVMDNTPEIQVNTPTEKEVDPMQAVDQLMNNSQKSETSGKLELKDAIATIRSCIEDLGSKGFFINVEEIDFDNNYQITMQIHKDN